MTSKHVCKFYVLLNGVNDVAYFGFVVLQFLLLEPTLRALLPAGRGSLSIWVTITLISSQLLFQTLAEGPTGAFADRYGRARAVAVSFWCRLAAIFIVVVCVLVGLGPDSPAAARVAVGLALVLAQVLMATGEAFLDGSIEAWLTDECMLATPERWERRVGKALEDSAIVQNCAILVSYVTVLAAWRFSRTTGGVVLAAAAGCLCLGGAAVAHWLSAREEHKRAAAGGASGAAATLAAAAERAPAPEGVRQILRAAYDAVVHSEDGAVRRVIAIVMLPFPGWVMLSWFYTAVVKSGGSDAAAHDAEAYALWLGVTLGVARVLGACVGKLLARGGGRGPQLIFEKAVLVNASVLFGAALLLVLRLLTEGSVASWGVIALFFPAAALAKASEEVIKLNKSKFLSSAVQDDARRATTLSFVSVAQNAFGFAAISLSGLLAFTLTDADARHPAIIFAACASVGLAGWLIYHGGKTLAEAKARRVGRP
jgi:MFS family permease